VRPDGVFCINDSLATGFIDSARAHGLGIPADIAVIGYNDTSATTAAGPLSSIRQPHEAFGATAVDLLIEEFSHIGDTDRRQVVFNPELVVRASTVS
jgi:LacI family transcriptional regulator